MCNFPCLLLKYRHKLVSYLVHYCVFSYDEEMLTRVDYLLFFPLYCLIPLLAPLPAVQDRKC